MQTCGSPRCTIRTRSARRKAKARGVAPERQAGVYYVEVPDKPEPQGCIDLLTPIDLKEMTFLKGDSNTHCRIVPKAGDLLIFPAYVKHHTHPFFGDGVRIAVVFNVGVSRD